MKKHPSVSVLIPVYNTSDYLRQCLDSVCNQTLEDIEIICVNDGSTDNSLEILKEYAAKDSRIIIVNKPNGGLPSARNAGLEIAKGEYVGFVDSDDYIDLNMYKKMYAYAKKDHSDVVICGAHIFPLNPRPSQWLVQALSPKTVYYKSFTPEILFGENGSRPFIWRDLIRRELFEKNGIRLDPNIIVGEDQALQLITFPLAKGVTFIDDKFYYYRWSRPDSIMAKDIYQNYENKTRKHIYLLRHIANEWAKRGYSREYHAEFIKWALPFIFNDFIKLSPPVRVRCAKELSELFEKIDVPSYRAELHDCIFDMYTEISKLATEQIVTPDVSVIVNADATGKLLTDCLDSICSQTLKNIEIICIDNSSDKKLTHDILTKYRKNDIRISVSYQGQLNFTESLSNGFTLHRAKYFIYIDSGERFTDKSALEKMLLAMQRDGTDAVCTPCGYSVTPEGIPAESMQKLSCGVYSQREAQLTGGGYVCLASSDLLDKDDLAEDYCLVGEIVYLTSILARAGKFSVIGDGNLVFREHVWMLDWIYNWQVLNTLKGFSRLVEISELYEMPKLKRITKQLLDSEWYIHRIAYGCRQSVNKIPNEKLTNENLVLLCEVFRILFELAKKTEADSTEAGKSPAVIGSLQSLILEQHNYLNTLL